MVIQDPDADITERSWARDLQSEILHKCSYRILGELDTDILHKRSSYTDLAQVLLQDSAEEILNALRKRSPYRDRAQEVLQDPDADILTERSSYRDLAQEVLQDLGADIMTERSCTRDPHTEILHK